MVQSVVPEKVVRGVQQVGRRAAKPSLCIEEVKIT